MKKTIIFGIAIFFFLVLMPLALADTFGKGENATIFGICINGSNNYLNANATLSAWYPNSSLFINASNMTSYATGKFTYTFVAPNITGSYETMINCQAAGLNAYGWDQFTISEQIETSYWQIAIIIGLIGCIIVFLINSTMLSSEYWFTQVVLYAYSLFFGLICINMAGLFIENSPQIANLNTILSVIINWVIYIFISYLFIYLTIQVVKSLKQKNKKKEIDEDEDNE